MQKSRKQATLSAEKDFFKILNNSNLGIDCRNNIDNCILEPLYDDLQEISYIKKFTIIFNYDTFRIFFLPVHMRGDYSKFSTKNIRSRQKHPTYETRKEYFENKMD